jgi:hypothetical protein
MLSKKEKQAMRKATYYKAGVAYGTNLDDL